MPKRLADYPMGGSARKGAVVKELLILVGIVAVWYILNRWVLPRFGVQT